MIARIFRSQPSQHRRRPRRGSSDPPRGKRYPYSRCPRLPTRHHLPHFPLISGTPFPHVPYCRDCPSTRGSRHWRWRESWRIYLSADRGLMMILMNGSCCTFLFGSEGLMVSVRYKEFNYYLDEKKIFNYTNLSALWCFCLLL